MITYEKLYLDLIELKKHSQGKINSIKIQKESLYTFVKIGLVKIDWDNYIYCDWNEKKIDIDLNFYFTHIEKLDFFGKNPDIRFYVHFILFNVNSYLSQENLLKIVKSKLNIVNNDDLFAANKILIESSLIRKEFCSKNICYFDMGKVIMIKDDWIYNNKYQKDNMDYIQRISMNGLIKLSTL